MADVECEIGIQTCVARGENSNLEAGEVQAGSRGQPGGEGAESLGSLVICWLRETCGGWESRGARRPGRALGGSGRTSRSFVGPLRGLELGEPVQ